MVIIIELCKSSTKILKKELKVHEFSVDQCNLLKLKVIPVRKLVTYPICNELKMSIKMHLYEFYHNAFVI